MAKIFLLLLGLYICREMLHHPPYLYFLSQLFTCVTCSPRYRMHHLKTLQVERSPALWHYSISIEHTIKVETVEGEGGEMGQHFKMF